MALFEDLKKLRDGLTHPRPVAMERRQEVLEQREEEGGALTVSRLLEEKLTEGFVKMNGIASFTEDPTRLSAEDAEQAFEIALLHLVRFEAIAGETHSGWFDVYDEETNTIRTPEDLLRVISRRFGDLWPV